MLRTEKGLSLIEFLIGVLISLVVALGAIAFFSGTSKTSGQLLKTVRLENELENALSLMVKDIRRAGYSANAAAQVGTGVNNDFMEGAVDISTPTASCILFSYDLNSDGLLPALGASNSDERFGYRLNSQTIEARATTDANFDCNSGSWEPLTAIQLVSVTALSFTLTTTNTALSSPYTGSVRVRSVAITITGNLVSEPSVSRTVSSQVRVRNDKYIP